MQSHRCPAQTDRQVLDWYGFYFRFVDAADVETLMDRALGALEVTQTAAKNLLAEFGA